jgi:hypothetical protein
MKSEDQEFSLVIDAFTPSTLPMERLAKYLHELAGLLGSEASVHFDRVAPGSARLVTIPDQTAIPKIEKRLLEVGIGTASKTALAAHKNIDDLLADDNAVGHIAKGKAKLVIFPGRNRPKPDIIGPIRRAASVEGQIFLIGGKDETINIHLRQKAEEIKIEVSVALAKRLVPFFLGQTIRLTGEGDWYRIDGRWTRKTFAAFDFVPLEEHSMQEAVSQVRSIFAGIDGSGIEIAMNELRYG